VTNDSGDDSGHLGFGIDIGGSGMKAAVVDLTTGELRTDRKRIKTPKPATPEAMADVVRKLVEFHDWSGPVGVAFPAVVQRGIVHSAANIDTSWIGVDADATFTAASAQPVTMVNDADAAGLAEVRFGAGKDVAGVVMMLTFGTGIGSGLFVDGRLVPNTELGHLELDGHDAESRAAASVRERHHLSWKHWAKRVDAYLHHVEMLFSPDLFILGGGVSKESSEWFPHLSVSTPFVAAQMLNNAGIVGAALIADAQPAR
jgi:polyphosphate glucokinase